jgi:hypothetical protein
MGRQVIVFMSKEDEAEFMDFILGTGKVEILPGRLKSRSERLETLPIWGDKRSHHKVYLHNTEVMGDIVYSQSEESNLYFVERLYSPVIEFALPSQRENALMSGRIYATFGFWDDKEAYVPMDPAFSKWYDKISRWIKRRYECVNPLTYAGPGAFNLKEKGGVFRDMGAGW